MFKILNEDNNYKMAKIEERGRKKDLIELEKDNIKNNVLYVEGYLDKQSATQFMLWQRRFFKIISKPKINNNLSVDENPFDYFLNGSLQQSWRWSQSVLFA